MKKTETLTLRVARKKKSSLLRLLKSLDYVEVETQKDKIARYIKTAPKNIPLTDADITKEVSAVRYKNDEK